MNCQDCLWFDLCNQNRTCENFTPLDDSYAENEYETDLHMRAEIYKSYVDEMNGNA